MGWFIASRVKTGLVLCIDGPREYELTKLFIICTVDGFSPEWSVFGWAGERSVALAEVRLCLWSVADWWSSVERQEYAAAVGYGSRWMSLFVSLNVF